MADLRALAESLRREHGEACQCGMALLYPCCCGAPEHNARVDALLAGIDEERRHADRLLDVLAAWTWHETDLGRVTCNVCGREVTEHDDGCDVGAALSAHRARRGGR